MYHSLPKFNSRELIHLHLFFDLNNSTKVQPRKKIEISERTSSPPTAWTPSKTIRRILKCNDFLQTDFFEMTIHQHNNSPYETICHSVF